MTREYYVHHWLGNKFLPEKFQTIKKITLSDQEVLKLYDDFDVMITSSNSGTADAMIILDQRGARFKQR